MSQITLYDLLRIGHIKRWHNVNTSRDQTVAEHSYVVAIIALDLFQSVVGIDPDNGDGSMNTASDIMLAAIFHDSTEVIIGDIPTPAKKLILGKVGDPDFFDQIEKSLMPHVPYSGNRGFNSDAMDFVKMADRIESYYWITENGVGNHAKAVALANRGLMEAKVFELEQKSGTDWLNPVNRVLETLGMPYISRASRLTFL